MKQKLNLIIAIIALILFNSCKSSKVGTPVKTDKKLAYISKDYGRHGITETPSMKEDGMRTDGKEGSYEWWYTDAEFDDGTTVVVTYYAKYRFDIDGPAHPTMTIDLSLPDGTKIHEMYSDPKGTVINAKKGVCDVTIGDSHIKYVDGHYEVYVKYKDIEYKGIMKSTQAMWRPNSGHVYVGKEDKDYFAWVIAQPSATVTATLDYKGKKTELTGSGYHDHNWGNIAMNKIVNHWYWARASIEGYNIIAAQVVTEKEAAFTSVPVFMVAKDGKLIEDDNSKTIIKREKTVEHEVTGKFYDDHITFIQEAKDGTKYTIELLRKYDIKAYQHINDIKGFKKVIGKLMGIKSSYIRSVGDVILTIEKDGKKEVFKEDHGIWEQMHFGNNKDAHVWN